MELLLKGEQLPASFPQEQIYLHQEGEVQLLTPIQLSTIVRAMLLQELLIADQPPQQRVLMAIQTLRQIPLTLPPEDLNHPIVIVPQVTPEPLIQEVHTLQEIVGIQVAHHAQAPLQVVQVEEGNNFQ